MERVRQGDALALEAIFTAFHAELIELARRTAGGRQALADDVVQDVFLAIWSGREQWRYNGVSVIVEQGRVISYGQ